VEFWTGDHGRVSDFKFQHQVDGQWVDILSETANRDTVYSRSFPAVSASKVRLYASAGEGKQLSLREITVYEVEELEEVEFVDEDTGEKVVEGGTTETNVAQHKTVSVDSGGGAIATNDEEWNLLRAGNDHWYIQHREGGRRVRAAADGAVDLVAGNATGAALEWKIVDAGGKGSYLVNRADGGKLKASTQSGSSLSVGASESTGPDVRWRTVTGVARNRPPTFRADAHDGGRVVVDGTYQGSLAGLAADADGERLSYRKVAGPSWLVVGPDGTLWGRPDREDVGENVWTVEVFDDSGAKDQIKLLLGVESEGPANLALNKRVKVDSEHADKSNPAAKAVDGTHTGKAPPMPSTECPSGPGSRSPISRSSAGMARSGSMS